MEIDNDKFLDQDEYSQVGVHPNLQSQPPGGMFAVCVSWPFGPGWFGSTAFSTALGQYSGPLSSNVTSGGAICVAVEF